MNKKAQIPYMQEVFAIIIGLILLGTIVPLIAQSLKPNCPACDCSQFQNNLNECSSIRNNLTNELNNRPVIYVNQTIQVPVEKIIEKPVYNEGKSSEILISLSLILSLSLTLFSFKIKLPHKLEQELYEMENLIKFFKFGSLILTILIFIKLLIVFNIIGR